MILLTRSIPPLMPMAMMTSAQARPTICHTPLPSVKIPWENIMPTASPSFSVSGAVAPNAPTMLPISVPSAYSPPLMPMKQYLKIQPITTV